MVAGAGGEADAVAASARKVGGGIVAGTEERAVARESVAAVGLSKKAVADKAAHAVAAVDIPLCLFDKQTSHHPNS